MLESIMLIALGFLTASLFALIAIQFVWRRAVKVTTRNLTNDLDLEDLKRQTERAAALDIALQDKRSQIATLSDKNAQLEETLTNTRQQADTLSQDIADLQASQAEARAEAETHLHNLTLLHTRIKELEATAHSDMEKRHHVASQLKSLGEKAMQLVGDMSAVAADFGAAAHEPQTNAARPDTPTSLTPFPADEPDARSDNELPDLAEIKASLPELNDREISSDQHDEKLDESEDEDPSHTTESYLADRIRALKAGVSTPA